jgi:hypothetical protein
MICDTLPLQLLKIAQYACSVQLTRIFFIFSVASLRTSDTDIRTKQVADTRPPSMRSNYTDVSMVTKYELPPSEYEKRDDSVLAWKKAKKLGRFDPVGFPGGCRFLLSRI